MGRGKKYSYPTGVASELQCGHSILLLWLQAQEQPQSAASIHLPRSLRSAMSLDFGCILMGHTARLHPSPSRMPFAKWSVQTPCHLIRTNGSISRPDVVACSTGIRPLRGRLSPTPENMPALFRTIPSRGSRFSRNRWSLQGRFERSRFGCHCGSTDLKHFENRFERISGSLRYWPI